MQLIIFGIIGLVLAGGLAVVGVVQFSKLSAFEKAKTYTTRQLYNYHNSKGGNIALWCEVKGQIECDEPLTAPLSQQPCVAYVHHIVRERQEEYEVDDELYDRHGNRYIASVGMSGGKRKELRTKHERMPDEGQRVSFLLRDSTGSILVDPQGAELDMEQTEETYEESEGWKYTMSTSQNRTLGFRRTEYVLPADGQCYVLGCAVDRQGRLIMSKHPRDRKQKFFISSRSEEQLTQSAMLLSLLSLSGAIIFGAGGIVLIVLGLR